MQNVQLDQKYVFFFLRLWVRASWEYSNKQGISGGIVTILGGGSMDYSE